MKNHCMRCTTCLATNQYGYTNDPDSDNFKVKLFQSKTDYTKPNETKCATGARINEEMDKIFNELKQAKN